MKFSRISSILFFLLLCTIQSIFAQHTGAIRGTVIESNTNERVDYASVVLLKQADQGFVSGVQSDANGKFSFQQLADGTFTIRITFVGYRNYEKKDIAVKEGKLVDLGNISLHPEDSKVLNEVVIEGKAPSMQLGIDRKVFNVAQSLVSEGGSASDLLANVPSLSVDMDGAVSLRGSTSVQILIDGKPSAMAGNDITQTLQSLPANSIQSIEVITNPSSKYEADGQSGIINIILKKNVKTGLNGMVNVSGGSYNNYNGGLTLNYRDTKFNYFGSYNYRRGNRLGDGYSHNLNLSNQGITNNNRESTRKDNSHSAKLGVDYYITASTTIGLSGNMNLRDNNRFENLFYQYFNQPDLQGTSDRTSDQNEDDLGYDVNLDLKREFKRKGEELLVNVSYGKSKEDGLQFFDQIFADESHIGDRRLNDTYENGDNTNIQLDYTLPLDKDRKFEAGYRTSIRKNKEEQLSDNFDFEDNKFIRDYDLTNKFDLEDIVHAIYSNYQSMIMPRLGFQAGLRLEQAYLNTSYIALDPEIPVDERSTPGKLDYLRLYPSLFLTQKLNGEQQLQLSYTRRVRRPRGWQVNPFKDVSDEMNIRMGNPNLQPEDIHSFEFSYAKFWPRITLTSSAYHRRVNDVIENIRISADEETTATISQWFNLSKNEATGFELISKVDLNKNIDVTANFNFFYTKFHGSADYNLVPKEGYNWDGNISTNVKILNNLTAQVRGDYRAPQIRAQGRSNASFVMDAALKMDVLQKKASIMMNVRDLFNQRAWSGYTETPQFYQSYEHRWSRRMFSLSFNYRFGKQDFNQKSNRKKTNVNEEMGGDEGGQF